MNTSISNQEEFIENWYKTAEYILTNETNQISREEVDQLIAEATYEMTEEEADNFFKSLGGIVSKGLKIIAPVAKSLAPLIGTTAGATIGGPVGARIGGALGGAISNIGNSPQKVPTNPTVQSQGIPTSSQRPLLGGVLSPAQIGQINQIQTTPTSTMGSQVSTSHSPVTNQLLMLINNPEFLIRLLKAVIPNNSRQRTTTGSSEEFIQDINTIKLLSEEILNAAYKDNQQETIEGIQDNYYHNENETHCECAH